MASSLPSLSYWDRVPPYAALATINLANIAIDAKADPKGTKETVPSLTLASGYQLTGIPKMLRYLARSNTNSDSLYGSSPENSSQIDDWVDYACASVVSASNFEAVCTSMDAYLAPRTYMVGYNLSIADLAVWGQLLACPLWKKVRSSGKVANLDRWFDMCNDQPCTKAVVATLEASKKTASSANDGAVSKGGGDTGSFDVGLPNAVKGKVVTRFPPEPSGYLHIGHAKAALLNQHFADMYEGKLIVRFDDTNPSKEKDEFVENILNDIKDLGLRYERLTYTSDYFPQLMEIGERLIKAGHLYADDTPVDQMREERMHGIESKCRNRSVEENLKLFEEMKVASEVGMTNCMRFKLDMSALNKCLRDPVAFRCNLTHHWRTGHTYKVYPTYDFACPFVDAFEGVTHALRTSEYKDREAQFYWILDLIKKVWPGLPDVHIWDYSRLNFVNTVLSKRKLTWFVDTKRVDGWNDPRMPTVQGILRRGLRIEALKEFILSQGASKNVTYQEWDKIWTINKKVIDPVCPRHTAVVTAQHAPLTLTNGPAEPENISYLKHKKYPPAGKKIVVRGAKVLLDQVDAQILSEGEEVTLMDWGNAFIRKITKDASGVVTAMEGELHLAGDVKKTKTKLTWLTATDELVDLTLVDFDYLINKKKVEEDDNFMDLVNEASRFETAAIGDMNMRTLQKGDIIQLERKGYYIVDEPLTRAGKPIVLFTIPDGRAKSVATK